MKKKIISILKFNDDPSIKWINIEDLQEISELSELELNECLKDLIQENMISVSSDKRGMKIALREKLLDESYIECEDKIKEALDEAVNKEDYELAARLRDILKENGFQ